MDLPDHKHDRLFEQFGQPVPARYNIGVDVCDRWAAREPHRPAIVDWASGRPVVTTFGMLRETSGRLAAVLRAHGVAVGDRVAILLPQGTAVVAAHVALYKLGAVALPLAAVFGPEGLNYRLVDSGAKACITDASGVAKLRLIAEAPPALASILSVDGQDGPVVGLPAALERADPVVEAVASRAEDPALMIYTSGTTGQPKGALHAHRVLLGHLPGVRFSHEGLPQPGDVMWTPADWAWAGGLLNALLPSLRLGVPVVCRAFEKFDPEAAWAFMAEAGVRNAFIPPTALRLLGTVRPPARRPALRTVTSAGEALGAETVAWGRDALGVSINDVYGQTECNYVLASSTALGIAKTGAIGRAVPGHEVAVIRPDGSTCAPDEPGEIAVAAPDPALFLGYWNNAEATARKFRGRWMLTGDQARMDADGYVTFLGRDDDIITSAGYRIGPAEVEDCLLGHPAVAGAAVVGKPDAMRTEVVKAFVVLRSGVTGDADLAQAIQNHVRQRLSAHEYPREVVFMERLPTTTSGKILRRLLRTEA